MYCLEKGPSTFWGIRNNTGSWGIIPGHAKNNHFTRVPLGNGLASQSGSADTEQFTAVLYWQAFNVTLA